MQNRITTKLAGFMLACLLAAPAAIGQDGIASVQFRDDGVALLSASDSILVDRASGVLWINRTPITMDSGFLSDIEGAMQRVLEDPTEHGLSRAATILSRETLIKLRTIRDALNRPEDLITLRGLEQCGPDAARVGLTTIAWYMACTGVVAGTGGGAAPCYLAIAAWTASTWKVGDCAGRNQPRRGDSGHDNDPYSDGDGDGLIDVLDGCPLDPLKSDPGACGCGVTDMDSDGDGTPDCLETCPGEDDCGDDEDDDDECTAIEILSGQCR